MDREHQELFAELSGFLSLFSRNERQAIALAFDGLVDKCAAHFRSEEALLASVGYPELDGHAAIHALLLSRCEQLRASFDAMPKLDVELMAGRLFEMIVAHIVSADVDFYPRLKPVGSPL